MDISEAKEYLKMRCEKYKSNKELMGFAENIYGSEAVKEYDKKHQAIETVLSELEKKEAIINEMAKQLVEAHAWFYSEFDNFTEKDWIEYFRKKEEREGK